MLQRMTSTPPTRIVHLGLGAFSRSHTAWYTQHADDSSLWGISAYTGRNRTLPEELRRQDGLYSLIERGADGDVVEQIASVVSARSGADVSHMVADLAARSTSIVTLTITEAGYFVGSSGQLDLEHTSMQADLRLLKAGPDSREHEALQTSPGKILSGLLERHRTGGGAITLLSCDNLPANGEKLCSAVSQLAEIVAPHATTWLEDHVAFASSSVDRITPRVDLEELRVLESRYGHAPVVAEPFRDWVIQGDFPAGRPAWEAAGARFTNDLRPWESKKLWMLNGAHTLLACLGQLRGHSTVAQAIMDPVCRAAVQELWDEAGHNLEESLQAVEYAEALLTRFENPRIEHRLEQIAADTPLKLQVRVAPVAALERQAGRSGAAAAKAIAAWVVAARRGLVPGRVGQLESMVPEVLPGELLGDLDFLARVAAQVEVLESNIFRNRLP